MILSHQLSLPKFRFMSTIPCEELRSVTSTLDCLIPGVIEIKSDPRTSTTAPFSENMSLEVMHPPRLHLSSCEFQYFQVHFSISSILDAHQFARAIETNNHYEQLCISQVLCRDIRSERAQRHDTRSYKERQRKKLKRGRG